MPNDEISSAFPDCLFKEARIIDRLIKEKIRAVTPEADAKELLVITESWKSSMVVHELARHFLAEHLTPDELEAMGNKIIIRVIADVIFDMLDGQYSTPHDDVFKAAKYVAEKTGATLAGKLG